MWIHPTKDRAISVREAARLQTFPDSFVFCGTKDKQYQQVGNAVPPIMAKAIAKKLAKVLRKNLPEGENLGGQPFQSSSQHEYVPHSQHQFQT